LALFPEDHPPPLGEDPPGTASIRLIKTMEPHRRGYFPEGRGWTPAKQGGGGVDIWHVEELCCEGGPGPAPSVSAYANSDV